MATKKKMLMSSAGTAAAGGGGAALDIDDVFSTYLYEGNGGSQVIQNGINLGQSFGSGSVLFSDDSSDWLVSQSSSEFAFGTGDFTLECWVYRASDTGSTNNLIDLRESDNTENKPSLAIDSSDKAAYYSNGSWRSVGTTSVPVGQWVHLAVVRSSGTTKVYYNGTAEGTAFSDSYNYSASTVANIGGAWSGDFDLDGYIAEARISDTARYTANFTTPTAPFSSDANTVLLTCKGADPFVDNSPNAFTITQNGTPTATTFGPFDAAEAGEGGMVWFKAREIGNYPPVIFDTNRGVTKYLRTSEAFGEQTSSGITAFNSDGFDIAGSFTTGSATPYVSWTFRKAPKFFTCLTYSGTGPGSGANEQQVSHDLDAKPGLVMIKRTDATGDWWVFTDVIDGSNDYGYLNQTAAFGNSANNVATDSVFNVGGTLNTSGATYVAYLFANNNGDGTFGPDGDQDIIKCGSYTGTGAAGNFIDLGFEPQWVLYKQTNSANNWVLQDNMRGMTHTGYDLLYANTSGAEVSGTAAPGAKAEPNGFSIDLTGGEHNATGSTYIYVAIRRGPLAVPEDATEVFKPVIGSGVQSTGFPVDFLIGLNNRTSTQSYDPFVKTRLLGGVPFLTTSSTAAEASGTDVGFDTMDGLTYSWPNSNAVAWYWKRAPGYFDAVAYSGNGTAGRTVSHNLTVPPEMMWIKNRDVLTENWIVYAEALGNTRHLRLNENEASITNVPVWNNTSPTSTEFTISDNNEVNRDETNYIAYLFASAPGVSKVGSLTYSGSTLNVDCGFSNGARFVLIKRTDSTGNWLVFDVERGIVAGADPVLSLNTTDAEGSYDWIDPYSSGFTLAAGAWNNGDYIFYAIA